VAFDARGFSGYQWKKTLKDVIWIISDHM